MNIARHMDRNHNASTQVFAEQQFEEDAQKVGQYFRVYYEAYEQLGMKV